jgi:predicted ATPase/class 3 adenylate cyclase
VEELPSGTVTFLFTDLEGSTRLWDQEPEVMRLALARHDEIVRRAVSAHSGHVVKGRGDGVHAVFAIADAAVRAAIDCELAMDAEAWTLSEPLQARIGIHTGAAELRDGDYFGSAVNRAARLEAIAHGGQILCSQATTDLARDMEAEGVAFVDLGEHRLRDLSRAERVFQVRAPGLQSGFAPLASVDTFPGNLPVQLTSFIGRESEIASLVETLDTNRFVTLIGAAGCGKTRLALQVGAETIGQFPDGVWLVELAALSDPALLLNAVAASLGIGDPTGGGAGFGGGSQLGVARPLEVVVLEHLRFRNTLVILDNCEHMLGTCAHLVDHVLHECLAVRILATSREPLGVAGEATRRVPSLSVPDPARPPPPERLVDYEAVRLFLDRATLRVGGLRMTANDAPAIAQICCRLDGIPLAIELAAARVKVLSPQDIAARLDDQFQLLTGGSRTALKRHQTLRAAVDWSYQLLTPAEQALLARLSVFAGSFSLAAVEAVCNDDAVPVEQVLDVLEHLVDRSLVDTETTQSGVRCRLLESIRQYGRERLVDFGDGQTWLARHRDFFAEFAASAQRGLWGPEQGRWLTVVQADLENVRAAIDWSLACNDNESALRIATTLDAFWIGRLSNNREGLLWLEQCFAAGVADAPAPLRAQALGATSYLAYSLGDGDRALDAALDALSLHRELGSARGLGLILNQLSMITRALGRYREAESYSEEAVAVGRQTGFAPQLGGALMTKAFIALDCGDFDGARAACHEVLASRDRQPPITVVEVLGSLGCTAFAEGDYVVARTWFQEAADIESMTGVSATQGTGRGRASTALALGDHVRARRIREETLELIGDTSRGLVQETFWLDVLANVALAERDLDEAERILRRGLELYELSQFHENWLAASLAALARIALARNDSERAARLLGASDATREQLGITVIALEWPPPADTIADVRAALGDDAFSLAWTAGRALSPDHAVDYALRREPRGGLSGQPDDTQP